MDEDITAPRSVYSNIVLLPAIKRRIAFLRFVFCVNPDTNAGFKFVGGFERLRTSPLLHSVV